MPPIGFSCALKGSCCQQRGPAASTATTADTLVPKTQTTSPTTPRFSPFFTEVVCTLGTTAPQTVISPPPNGGNGVIRTTTRRRHADSQPLMLQNPHRHRHGGRRRYLPPCRGRRGLAGQRADAPIEASSADGRSGRAAAHRHTLRPGPPTPATPVGPQQHVVSYNPHPHSWSQPTKIPTFPYQKAEKSRS